MRVYHFRSWILALASISLLLNAIGCTEQREGMVFGGWGARDVASRRLLNINLDAVQPIADRAFRQYFRVDRQASSAHEWFSHPTESSKPRQSERVRDWLSASPNRHRLLAGLRIIQEGKHVLVQCRVRIERLDTAERAAFASERGDDRPTDTPIDRAGASSADVREEWVRIGRDRQTEYLILEAIQEQLDTPKSTE